VNYQPQSRVTLSGRYAAKMARDDVGAEHQHHVAAPHGARTVRPQPSPRCRPHLLGPDGDGFSSRRYGLGAELGLIVMKNLRVAGGYNVSASPTRTSIRSAPPARGLYLDLGFKFDESLSA
jgi:hypothetical protein